MMPLIEYTGKNVYRVAGTRFFPGVNDVSAEAWAKVLEHPMARHRVKSKILVEQTPDNPQPAVENEEEARDVSLKDFTAEGAIDLVKKTVDAALLSKWAGEEKRVTVSKALLDQLVLVDPTKKDEE